MRRFWRVVLKLFTAGFCFLAFLCAASRIAPLSGQTTDVILFNRIKLPAFHPFVWFDRVIIKGLIGANRAFVDSVFSQGLWGKSGNLTCWPIILLALVASIVLFIILSSIINVLLRSGNKKTTIFGSARWATTREFRKIGLVNPTGMVMGQTNNSRYKRVAKPKPKRKKGESNTEYQERLVYWQAGKNNWAMKKPGEIIAHTENQHTLIVGATRSGKGINCIIPTELSWPGSMIVFDPKSEGWGITSNFRSKFSYTFKFEPEKPWESAHYNPLLAIRRGKQTLADVMDLANILMPDIEGATDPFWNTEGRRLFATLCAYVIYCMPLEKRNFASVYGIFSNKSVSEEEGGAKGGVKAYLAHYAKTIDTFIEENEISQSEQEEWDNLPDEEKNSRRDDHETRLDADDIETLRGIQRDLLYFANCEDKQLNSVISTTMSNLIVISDPNVQAVTDRSDFCMEDFMDLDHPMSLYLCCSLASIKRLAPLMKVFYEQAITLLTRELKKTKHKLLLVFDEFRQMGKMEIVERALALSAGYGVICCIVIQSYDQLKTIYQSEAIFLDNFGYQVILSVQHPDSLKRVEEMLGQGTVRKEETSYSGNMGNLVHKGENISVHEQGRSLMTAQEIKSMPFDDLLILATGQQPYKAKKIMYFLDKRFTRLIQDKKGNKYPVPVHTEYKDGKRIVTLDLPPTMMKNQWKNLKGVTSTVRNIVMNGSLKEETVTFELNDDVRPQEKKEEEKEIVTYDELPREIKDATRGLDEDMVEALINSDVPYPQDPNMQGFVASMLATLEEEEDEEFDFDLEDEDE